jgi:hypothetical protein
LASTATAYAIGDRSPVSGRRPSHAVPATCENQRVPTGIERYSAMDKKAKTPKKPKQTKNKDGSAKTK